MKKNTDILQELGHFFPRKGAPVKTLFLDFHKNHKNPHFSMCWLFKPKKLILPQ